MYQITTKSQYRERHL